MPRLYQISVRWETLPLDADALKPFEAKMTIAGDWMRFSAWTWFVSSQYNPTQIRDTLRPTMNPNDHFLILEISATGTDGFAAPWIWEWLRTRNR